VTRDPVPAGETARGRPGLREVAQLAGVAISSVSRVVSGHPDVSPAMRERVMGAVDELGYEPDLLAQSLRRRATNTVGFVVGDISNPLLAEIALGAETTLRQAGYSMLLTNSENDPERDAGHARLLLQRRVDGLLLSLAAEGDRETIRTLENASVPIVLIDRELPASVRASAVLSEHRAGMRAAVAHLLELGHRRVGLIVGQPLRFSRERRRGLEEAYEAAGLPATYRIMEGTLDSDHGRSATAAMLDGPDPPTAVIAGGNQILVGALEELIRRGLRPGADLSLVSCDATPLTRLTVPPISVVQRDSRELGRTGAQLLLRRMEQDADPELVVLPTRFVPTKSCGPPP
jgi:LacI family transcriptional regulator